MAKPIENTYVRNMVRRRLSARLASMASQLPTLQAFIDEAASLSPELSEAVCGFWCGRDGVIREPLPNFDDHMLVVGWHERRVEYAYIS